MAGFNSVGRDQRSGQSLLARVPILAGLLTFGLSAFAATATPLYFEANHGQAVQDVQFIARGADCNVLITPTEAVLMLGNRDAIPSPSSLDRLASIGQSTGHIRRVRFQLAGANAQARATGLGELPGKANYYLGNDPANWRAGIPLFSRVQVDEVYPGVRLVYYADASGRLEYDFELEPNAAPERITFQIEGVDAAQIDAAGDLILNVGQERIRQHKPILYQVIDGIRNPVAGGYRLKGDRRVGFLVGAYDRRQPLVIDPVVTFSTYLGGTKNDRGWGIATDNSGNVWVAGETLSEDLRDNTMTSALQPVYQGGHHQFGDSFVARFAQGTNLTYLTYLGGEEEDGAFAVAVDQNSGAAFVTGFTASEDFPIFPPGVYQTHLGGTNLNGRRVFPIDAFVTKLDTNGALVHSTYLGGNSRDVGLAIAVDNLGRAYVTGLTESSNFATVNALQGRYAPLVVREGGTNFYFPGLANYDGSVNHSVESRSQDAFVARLNPDATGLEYYTYLGGSNQDIGQGIAVDSAYCAYVVGQTWSFEFPVTNTFSPYALSLDGEGKSHHIYPDGFISKLSATGQALVYSSYVGGVNNDAALAVKVDAAMNAYVAGYTYSTNFPRTVTELTAWTSKSNYNADAFVVRFDPNGQTNQGYAVVFGAKYNDMAIGIALDTNQNAYVVGLSESRTNFAGADTPLMQDFFAANPASAFTPTNSSKSKHVNDAFLVALAPNGTNLFSAFLGGIEADQANAIALDLTSGTGPIAYVVGTTTSTNFPGTAPGSYHGKKKYSEAFLSRIQFP